MKTIKKILSILCLSFIISGAYADNHLQHDGGKGGVIAPGVIVTYTSEPCGIEQQGIEGIINGGAFGETVTKNPNLPEDNMKRYPCVVGANSGFVEFISELYRFMYFTALIFGVIMIVLAGIVLSMSGAVGDKGKEFAKKWIPKILIGIAALVFIPFILKTVAPFFFR